MRQGKLIEDIPTQNNGVIGNFEYRTTQLHIDTYNSLTVGENRLIGIEIAKKMEERRLGKKNSQPEDVHACNQSIYSSIAQVLNQFNPKAQPQARLNTILANYEVNGMPKLEKLHGVENYDLQRFEYIAKEVSNYFLRNPITES